MTRNRVFALLLIKLAYFYLVMGGSGLGPPNMTVTRVYPSDSLLSVTRVYPSDSLLTVTRVYPSDSLLSVTRVYPSDSLLLVILYGKHRKFES